MTQYLVTGTDFTTEGALDHRMAIRPQHIDMMKNLKESGNFLLGGAFLDEQGIMRGSSLVLQFETESDLQKWMSEEPYILNKVWETVDVKQYKIAQI
ncbi:hypothetical protein TH61_12085 [Rufibacter sp. DG15C]|uniref:YciI family protein n=1 Tax=Rufibacter sp. DG15C TaxID=1379909 RepID=UPI00078CAA23|nr:YciI family protein [Rufibacter sp. DG15C]AMM51767.1 hypothetical protein TH61_12085 [Rufibacter sp. DG15C]